MHHLLEERRSMHVVLVVQMHNSIPCGVRQESQLLHGDGEERQREGAQDVLREAQAIEDSQGDPEVLQSHREVHGSRQESKTQGESPRERVSSPEGARQGDSQVEGALGGSQD
jgi:hypothetical protein